VIVAYTVIDDNRGLDATDGEDSIVGRESMPVNEDVEERIEGQPSQSCLGGSFSETKPLHLSRNKCARKPFSTRLFFWQSRRAPG